MLMHITNSFQREWSPEIDSPMTRALKDRIINREQEKLDGYVSMGALLGEPVILFLESENSTTDVMNGDFRWDIAVTPTPPLKSASVYVASKIVSFGSGVISKIAGLFGGGGGGSASVSGYATGGFTRGPSIAGEDPHYPTEAVISFNPAYRSQNLSYWAEAGRMLGASDGESDYELLSGGSGTAVVYDLSGLSFSPQIKIEGDTDEDALIRKLRDLEPEFIDFILEALSRREGGAYVTADSRLY